MPVFGSPSAPSASVYLPAIIELRIKNGTQVRSALTSAATVAQSRHVGMFIVLLDFTVNFIIFCPQAAFFLFMQMDQLVKI